MSRIAPAAPTVTEFWGDYVRQANEMLAIVRGEVARWWTYSVSMRTFELVVGDPSGRGGNVLLRTLGCESIAGPTSWMTLGLDVVYHGTQLEPGYELRDEGAGFRVRAETFRWELDVDLLNRVVDIGFR